MTKPEKIKAIQKTLGVKAENFHKRVVKLSNGSGCWMWTGSIGTDGYGRMNDVKAHRISYVIHKGEIPSDKPCVLHTCDTPSCVNPDHLYAGTVQDNSNDMVQRNRQSCGERHYCAKLSPETVKQIRVWAKFLSSRKLAQKFGMSRQPILRVINRITWKSVA